MPELPEQRKRRFIDEYKLSSYEAGVLTSERHLADYFESLVKEVSDPGKASNWVMREILGELNKSGISIEDFPISPTMAGELINLVTNGVINASVAAEVFGEMIESGSSAETIVKKLGLEQISSRDELEVMVNEVIAGNPEEVERYRSGNRKLLGFFIGEVMKMSGGKANPKLLNELFEGKLDRSAP